MVNLMVGKVAVIGGGAAGIETAGQLARLGYKVILAEKSDVQGGHIASWHQLFPDRRSSSDIVSYLKDKAEHSNITFLSGTEVSEIEKKNERFILRSSDGNSIEAEAVVVASGFDLFRSERKEEYGYGIYNNVITSADLEVMFRNGKIHLKNNDLPKRIGMIHCVGSRDEKVGNLYCSKLCCVTAVKQAIEVKEHIPDARVFCFYMDMRMGGSMYEELYREAQEKYNISFIRGKVSEIGVNIDNKLIAKVEDTLAGRPLRMELDMVVLMAGMEISASGRLLAQRSGLKAGESRFLASADGYTGTNLSNVSGIFYAGTCTGPMSIPETISHARAAAVEVDNYLKNGKKQNG